MSPFLTYVNFIMYFFKEENYGTKKYYIDLEKAKMIYITELIEENKPYSKLFMH